MQEPHSFIRASIIAKRQQRRGGEALDPRRRLCLPHCPRLCPGRAPATTAGKPEKPPKAAAEDPSHHSGTPPNAMGLEWGDWEEAVKLLPSAEREPARNTCEPESKKIPRRGWLTCWR